MDEVGLTEHGYNLSMRNLEDNDRTAKTAQSSRMVPLHNHLVELGFDRYVEMLKSEGAEYLIPDARHHLEDNLGKNMSRNFNTYFRGLRDDLDTLRLTTHSLRHTFRSFAFEDEDGKLIDQSLVKVFMGHNVAEENLGRYGRKIYMMPDVLRRQVVERLVLPKIDPGVWQG